MENFKLASQQKLRFQTPKGVLSTEQLWDLALEELDELLVSLDTEHKESGKKSFLVKKSVKDKTVKLRFDVVMDVLTTKQEEMQAASEAFEIKEHNKKIIELISDKENEELKGKSVKDLKSYVKIAKAFPLAQLGRASASRHAEGHWFKSSKGN